MAEVEIQGRTGVNPADPFTLRYKILGEVGEGSYSKVLKCRHRETGDLFACKRLKQTYKTWNQVSEISELVTLRKLMKHPNILQMSEIHFDPAAGRVSLVFELMDMNLYELIKDRKRSRLLQENRVKNMIFQLIRGLRHLHKQGIFHRDVKPENILLKRMDEDEDEVLKLGDLGSVRGLYSRPPYTEYISTRWYRSPECLLTPGFYSIKMDIWATGCVFYEVLTLRPLFPGASELDQINRIHNIIGPPPANVLTKFMRYIDVSRSTPMRQSKQTRFDSIKKTLVDLKNGNGKANCDWFFGGSGGGVERLLPNHISPEARDLLATLLHYDPDLRPTAHRALAHPYFQGLRHASRNIHHHEEPADVIVSIGTTVKSLADVDGMATDLKTLGDCKLQKRLPRENPSKIPVRLPQKQPVVTDKEMAEAVIQTGPPVGIKLRKANSINTYNLNNIDSVMPMPSREETAVGKKVKSYDEFSQKAKAALPYEIVHIDPNQHKPIIHPHQKGQGSEATLTQGQGQPSSRLQPSPRRASVNVQVQTRSDKVSSEAQLVQPHLLSSATLRRINENRKLVQLEPIANVKDNEGDLERSVKEGVSLKSSSFQQFNTKQSPRIGGGVESGVRLGGRVEGGVRVGGGIEGEVEGGAKEKRREMTPVPPPLRVGQPGRKLSFQFGEEQKAQPLQQVVRERKSLPAPDLNWNYRKVREENLTPPPLTQRLLPRRQPSASDALPVNKGSPRVEGNVKSQPGRPKPSLLDYQQFSARYKEKSSQFIRKRREEALPASESSSSEYNQNPPYERRLPKNNEPKQLQRRVSQIQPLTTIRNHKVEPKKSEEEPLKLSRLKEFIKTNLVNPPKEKEANLELDSSNSRQFYAPLRQQEQGKQADRSEGAIGGFGNEGTRFTSNSNLYYPSLHGKIRVSKPSLSNSIRSPSSTQLHPPPLMRHSEKIPFSLNLKNPRDPPKYQREALAKKKYSFLHDKQDFVFANKSKLNGL